jgi:hypothetical protein
MILSSKGIIAFDPLDILSDLTVFIKSTKTY